MNFKIKMKKHLIDDLFAKTLAEHRQEPSQKAFEKFQSRLKEIFGGNKELLAKDFLVLLSEKLPILDFGKYRKEIEDKLSTSVWRKPGTNELSQSLSFGLRRLEFKGAIQLRGKSDTGSSYRLIGSNNQELVNFETVTWNKNYEHS